jgi:hypothetical protein
VVQSNMPKIIRIKKWYIIFGGLALIIAVASYFAPGMVDKYYSRPKKKIGIVDDGDTLTIPDYLWSVHIQRSIVYHQEQPLSFFSRISTVKVNSYQWSINSTKSKPGSSIALNLTFLKYNPKYKLGFLRMRVIKHQGTVFTITVLPKNDTDGRMGAELLFPRKIEGRTQELWVPRPDDLRRFATQKKTISFDTVFSPNERFELSLSDYFTKPE